MFSADALSQFFASQTLYCKLCEGVDEFKSDEALKAFRDNVLSIVMLEAR